MPSVTSNPTILEVADIWWTMLVNHSSVHKDFPPGYIRSDKLLFLTFFLLSCVLAFCVCCTRAPCECASCCFLLSSIFKVPPTCQKDPWDPDISRVRIDSVSEMDRKSISPSKPLSSLYLEPKKWSPGVGARGPVISDAIRSVVPWKGSEDRDKTRSTSAFHRPPGGPKAPDPPSSPQLLRPFFRRS